MPKVSLPKLPVSGIFAIAKPSGPTSMELINQMKPLIARSRLFVEAAKVGKQDKNQKKKGRFGREAVKIGQGGTLDPLANGVLVIAVGKGTKKLSQFLDCAKEYRTTCLLGCETDTYDSEGARVRSAPWRHVTKESVENALAQFRGEIEQTPPIFSALKMDGRALYDYAREGIPLPRPIEKRKVTIHSLELEDWIGTRHAWRAPEKALSDAEKEALEKSLRGVDASATVADVPEPEPADGKGGEVLHDGEGGGDGKEVEAGEEGGPTAFVLRMTVSGGTYVRSIVHDLAHAVGSAGHVVTLTRSKQSRFVLTPSGDATNDVKEGAEGEKQEQKEVGCVPWEVFERAVKNPDEQEKDEDGWCEWEREVIERLEIV